MAMEGWTRCAVHGCTKAISGPHNLCNEHRLPGTVVSMGTSTMVITVWAADHLDETGIILLNDYALGRLFGGRAGFEAHLRKQGFTAVRRIRPPKELESSYKLANGKKLADWGGPWKTKYPWEDPGDEFVPRS
jgi:hypothetical protein